MKPVAMSVVSLLLFLFLLLVETSQGIRFDEELIAAFHRLSTQEHLQVGDALGGGVIPCRDDRLCSGTKKRSYRALQEVGHQYSKEEEVDKKKSHGNIDVTYPDVLGITGMDYSPALKKSPIHN